MSDTTRRTSSRRIHFFGTVFPLLMLLIYGITFALIGEKTLYRLDITYSTYETLRMFLGVLIPILFLLWGVAGTIIAERKTLSRGELTIRFCILALSTVIVIGTCYQEQQITRERFRDHDCRAALKQYFAKGILPHCPSSLKEESYLFFDRVSSSVPLPVAMDLPGNHEKTCNILYSDGSIVRLAVQNRGSCEMLLLELNRQHPLPQKELDLLLATARVYDAVPPQEEKEKLLEALKHAGLDKEK